jgi:hypothetical protein
MKLFVKTFVTIIAVLVMASAAAVVADVALAHVRDRDKVRLCNGYRDTMRHRHEGRLLRPDWYFYTRYDFRRNNYVHYDVWKRTGSLGRVVDRHNKVVNCRYY